MTLPIQLPVLTQSALRLYRAVWLGMLVLALIGASAGYWVEFQRSMSWDRALYGAGLRVGADGERLTISPISTQAQQAGLQPNSTLLAVDGVPVPSDDRLASHAAIAEAVEGPDGRTLRITVRAPDGQIAQHPLVRGPHHLAEADAKAPMTYRNRVAMYLLFRLIVAAALMAASTLLFRRRAADPVVALLAFGLLSPLAASACILIPATATAEFLAAIIASAGAIAMYIAMASFPSGRFEPRWSLLAVPLAFGALTAEHWASWAVAQPLIAILAVFTLLIIGRRYVLLPPGSQRQQVKWAALGFALLLLLLMAAMAVDLVDTRTSDNRTHFILLVLGNVLQTMAILALVVGLLISLLRYRLYDADAAISRSAVYAALTVSLLAIFAATEQLVEVMGEQYLGPAIGSASGALAAAFAAVMMAPLHKWMSDWAERRFQRNLTRLRRNLPLLVGSLRETATPSELSRIALERIADDVNADHAALLLTGSGASSILALHGVRRKAAQSWLANWAPPANLETLECDREDKEFPVRLPLHADGAGTIGWILLGPRPDGTSFGKDEREALAAIAEPVARGLAVAIHREKEEKRMRRANETLERRIAALEALVMRQQASPPAAAG